MVARLVARCFSQRKGFDYQETYSPVAKITTFRILLAFAVQNDLHIHQMDVKTAFLNGDLREKIYMKMPDGFKRGNLVCKLNKSLYGLKQASRMWNERFHTYVTGMGFQRSAYDYCLYTKGNNDSKIHLLLYVDDLLLIGSNLMEIRRMSAEFGMRVKDMNEMKSFLGIYIERDISTGTMHIHQRPYLIKLLRQFGMEDCNGIRISHADGMPSQARKNKSGRDYKDAIQRTHWMFNVCDDNIETGHQRGCELLQSISSMCNRRALETLETNSPLYLANIGPEIGLRTRQRWKNIGWLCGCGSRK